jgi:hypothetical protein
MESLVCCVLYTKSSQDMMTSSQPYALNPKPYTLYTLNPKP